MSHNIETMNEQETEPTQQERLCIETLCSLEPVFYEAGKLALEMQGGITGHNKKDSGVDYIDIVTEADLQVQEHILRAMQSTPLSECHLLAEEDTPTVKRFNAAGSLFLTLDPIDGTKIFANGGRFFTTIIGLHNSTRPLYTFSHYPALDWTHLIHDLHYDVHGQPDHIDLPFDTSKTIVYSYGNPAETIPDLYQHLTANGYEFRLKKELGDLTGSTTLLLAKKVAGQFVGNPLAVDGLAGLHYAQSQHYQIYSNGVDGELDLSRIETDSHGSPYHPGYYLALSR